MHRPDRTQIQTLFATLVLLVMLSVPIHFITTSATENVPEIDDKGGVVDVKVGPTPRSDSIVLGLVYLTIPEDKLGRIKLLVEADPRDLKTGKSQSIWLEIWTGRIGTDENVFIIRSRRSAIEIMREHGAER